MTVPLIGQKLIPGPKLYLRPAYYEDFLTPPPGWKTMHSEISWSPLKNGGFGVLTATVSTDRPGGISNGNMSLARSRKIGYRIKGRNQVEGRPTKIRPVLFDSEGNRISGPFHGVSGDWETYEHKLEGRKIDRLNFAMSLGSVIDFDRIWIT